MTVPKLEILRRGPNTPTRMRPPLLFVHGAFTGAWCWAEHFMTYFADHGWDTVAVSLRGHGGSDGKESRPFHRIADYLDDLGAAVGSCAAPPVLIGHSMGAFLVMKYLEHTPKVPAVVLMAPVPPEGLIVPAFDMLASNPVLYGQVALVSAFGPQALTHAGLRRALFSPDLPDPVSLKYYGRAEAESLRAIWDMSWFDLPRPDPSQLPPTLVMGGTRDAFIPRASLRHTADRLGADIMEIPDLAHAMMLDTGWHRAAEALRGWLSGHLDTAAAA